MFRPVKLLHTSDLHLGKKLCGFSLKEDQEHFLNQIIGIAKTQKVEAILIAGDIYDVVLPPEEAVRMFSDFLAKASLVCPVYVIPGNHDSAERIGYGKELFQTSDVYVTGRYSGTAEKHVLREGVNIFLLPYMKTTSARHWYRDENITTPDLAVKATLEHSDIDPNEINILVAHQFIAGRGSEPEQSESETVRLAVGGDDIIHSDLFGAFDYGAFGHIHRPQLAGRKELQYCGSPMKYSESEANDQKHVNVVTITEKGKTETEHVPLEPLNEMVVLKGNMEEVLEKAKKLPKNTQVYVTLYETADRANEILSGACNLFRLSFELPQTGPGSVSLDTDGEERLSDMDIFERFYEDVTGEELTGEQRSAVKELMEEYR